MIKAVVNTKRYFQAPRNYFWQWTDNTEVIEWVNGSTICYRNDLIAILRELSVEGFPPLTPLLLVLAATQKEIHGQEKSSLMRTMMSFEDSSLKNLVDSGLKFLEIVNALPPELKKGKSRIHLIYEVFEKEGFVFSNVQLNEALDELNSGRLDPLIIQKGDSITKEQFIADLGYLTNALERFPAVADLELKLRTGLQEIPAPAEIELPDFSSADLIEQLAQDVKTIGIARLARQLIPVLNIPVHSQGSGDQSYGGISDITNRGNYDKLLLSELAHDDILLTARLVNNEALYFRREEPPDNPKRQRTILLDVTLKMWGIPRVFAISTALAFAHNSKYDELIEAYALGGEKYTEVNLGSKEGIIQALEILHHSLHCGKSLRAVINDLPVSEQNEYILITDSRMFNVPEFIASLQTIKASLSFIVTVNRNGEVRFLECIKGNTKLLSTAKLGLEELLFEPAAIQQAVKNDSDRAPAYLSHVPAPLLFPKVRIKQIPNRLFAIEGFGAIAVNHAQRVLLIRDSGKGADELLNYIEKGTYAFGWDGFHNLYILVGNYQGKFLKFYKINSSTFQINSVNLSDEIQFAKEAIFNGTELYIRTNFASFFFDCKRFEVLGNKDYNGYNAEINTAKGNVINQESPLLLDKYFVNDTFSSTMYKIKKLCVNQEGKLAIGNYTLEMVGNNQNIRITENTKNMFCSRFSKEVNNQLRLLPNKNIKFTSRIWHDGSEVIIDSRGFLHLKSSDKYLPEITIVLITGNNTACWASDGVASGASYFIDENRVTVIPVEIFYKKYIQPFIDRLV